MEISHREKDLYQVMSMELKTQQIIYSNMSHKWYILYIKGFGRINAQLCNTIAIAEKWINTKYLVYDLFTEHNIFIMYTIR